MKITIVGAGMIGRAWIAAFVRAGFQVAVWSRRRETSDAALAYLREVLPLMSDNGLLMGRDPGQALAGVTIVETLEDALEDADYIQENAPEDLALKRALMSELDALAPPEAIIASSVSALMPSSFLEYVPGRHRCIVAHPLNPPHLVPATEIVPSPWNPKEIVDRTVAVLKLAGQKPVVLKKEIDGYIVNRLQAAILNEAFRLVADGVADIADVDTAIRDGLALRWSFMGPFETIDLNAPEGVRDYVARYNPLYMRLLSTMTSPVDWQGPALDQIERDRRAALPSHQLQERQLWRDRRLMALAVHKQSAVDAYGE